MKCYECENRGICTAPVKFDMAGCTDGFPSAENSTVASSKFTTEFGMHYRDKDTGEYVLFAIAGTPYDAKNEGKRNLKLARPGRFDPEDSLLLQRKIIEEYEDWEPLKFSI